MLFRRSVARALLLALVLAVAAPAGAAPDKPDSTGKAAAAAAAAALQMRKAEEIARTKAGDEIARLARYSALTNAYDEARRDFARALAFVPENAPLKAELLKIRGKTGKPQPATLAQIAERRKKALARCAELLAPPAAAYAQADRSDELASLIALMRAQGLPLEGALAKLDVVLYEPYLDWRTKKAVAKLNGGWEYVDGAWLDPLAVAALDAKHASWTDPWVFSDEVHEVRTTLPRRTAKQLLAHVGAYRRFFLDYFTGEWDLVPPKVKLPVILTRTRREMEEHMRSATGGGAVPPQAAAFYLSGGGEGNPCFVSFEANVGSGGSVTLDFEGLQYTFEHELGHQLAFEYSKHAAAEAPPDLDRYLWVVEGLAEFLPSYDFVDGAWKLRRRPWIPAGAGKMESTFGWCHENVDAIPPIADFVALPRARFLTAQNYHIAAALASFLLEENDREHRPRFLDLVEDVHQCRATRSSFAERFAGVDLVLLDKQFRAYLRALVVEEE